MPLFIPTTTKIVLPASVTTLSDKALAKCRSLKDVYRFIPDPSTVKVCNSNGGYELFTTEGANYAERTLHVPRGTANVYQTNEDWYPFFGQIVDDLMAGDVDGNGVLDISDIMSLIDHLLDNNITIHIANADGNGIIDIADITALIDLMLQN